MSSVYSVGQINAYIKMMFDQDFVLNRVYVKGEVSNCKYHTSGHVYFSLKDERGAISCVLFAGSRKGLSFRMQNGQQVVVFGSISVFERDGTYQLYAREIRLDGLGALYERYEALKRELEEMGMFAQEYKRPVPRYISRLGVVTAPTGAAVRDIIQIAKRRNPGIQIILYPAKVQGEGAAESVARGIEALDALGVDAMIVGRGGGSIEDLWAFNEETVARAIFACMTPVISAVGHETDTTIADFVADLRAPTPSAGAELAVADMRQVQEALAQERKTLEDAVSRRLAESRGRLEQYQLKLRLASPQNQIREKNHLLAGKEQELRHLMQLRLEENKSRLRVAVETMKGLSPLYKLEQGYAYVAAEDGKRIRRAAKARPGDHIQVYFRDGRIDAIAQGIYLEERKAEEKA